MRRRKNSEMVHRQLSAAYQSSRLAANFDQTVAPGSPHPEVPKPTAQTVQEADQWHH